MVEEEGRGRRGGSPFALSLLLSPGRALLSPLKGGKRRGHAFGALAPD